MKNNVIKIFLVCLITLSSLNSIAQIPGVNDPNGTLETNDVPINDYLLPMLLLGVVLGYSLLKKKKQLVK